MFFEVLIKHILSLKNCNTICKKKKKKKKYKKLFLWKNFTPKIKHKTLCNAYNLGRL